jgi:RHS repeat-associated protein
MTNYQNPPSVTRAEPMKGISMRTCIATIAALSLSAIASADMGRTAGTWGVSPNGAATYQIPIWVQPGPKGVQPSMAFTYDSQRGNGVMGVGWGLSGFGSIARCASNIAEDGTDRAVRGDAQDRFCINGNKLRITSGPLSSYGSVGAVYQTTFADFSRVTSVGGTLSTGPQSFLVHTKSGMILEYGNTADSRVVITGTTAHGWLLNRVCDRDTNCYVVTYSTDNTVGRVPVSVQWGNTTAGGSSYQYKATFNYTIKTDFRDIISFVQQGVTMPTKQRLSSVEIGHSASGSGHVTKRQYVLGYESSPTTFQSRLTEIKECAASVSNCLKPTAIVYQNGNAGVVTSGTTAIASASGSMASDADFNGDGRTDIAYSDGSVWRVAFSTGSGYSAGVSTGISSGSTLSMGRFVSSHQDGFIVNASGTVRFVGYNGTAFQATSTGTPWMANTVVTDYNGDGLQDMMWYTVVTVAGGTRTATLYLRPNTTTGTATVPAFAATATTSMVFSGLASGGGLAIVNTSKCPYERQCDINGDGRADLQLVVANPQGCGPSGCTSTHTGYDLLGGTVLANGTPQQVPVYFGLRFNDDPCTDTIRTGTTTLRVSSCGDAAVTNVALPAVPVAVMDWDGDGRTDLLVNSGGFIGVYRSRGSTTTPFDTLFTSTIPYVAACSYYAADVDGDALDELACARTTSPFSVTYYTHNGAGSAGSAGGPLVFATQVPDKMKSITDGYGMSVTPSYVSTAQAGRYTRGTNTSLPLVDATDAIIVVGRMTATDGAGGTYDLDYAYMGARRHGKLSTNSTGNPFGVGGTRLELLYGPDGQSAGFEEITTTDSRNTLKRKTTFEQLYPMVGMTKKEETFQADGTLISVVTNTNLFQPLDATPNNTRYFPYVSQSKADINEVGGPLNGQLITTTTRTLGYTNFTYGNVATDTTETTDKDSASVPSSANKTWKKVITYTYDQPLTSNDSWCVDFVNYRTSDQTTSSTSEGTVTRSMGFAADPASPSKCRVRSTTVEPDKAKYRVTETFDYDAFGNVSKMSVVGTTPGTGGAYNNMPARETNVTWNTTGQFPATIVDPSGSTTRFTYNLDLATTDTVTNPNTTEAVPLVVRYEYDVFGRKTKQTKIDGTYQVWDYADCATAGCANALHRMTVTATEKNRVNGVITDGTIYLDALDRTLVKRTRLIDGAANTYQWAETEYDAIGRALREYIPCTTLSPTVTCRSSFRLFKYDALNRVTETDRAGTVTKYKYAGRTETVIDPYLKESVRVVNINSTVRRIGDPNNYSINFSYDPAGTLLGITDSENATRLSGVTNEYGFQAFQVAYNDAALGSGTRTFNSLGEEIGWTDGNNQSFSATYDALSRPLSRSEASGAVTTQWEYGSVASEHNIGELKRVTSTENGETYQETYTYDNATRRIGNAIAVPGRGTFNYEYLWDADNGWLDTMRFPETSPGVRLALKHNYQNGELKSLVNPGTSVAYWTADNTNAFGQVTKETLGNGVITLKTFDAVTAALKTIKSGTESDPTSLQNLGYLYDLVGNVTQRQNNKGGLTEDFIYGGTGDNSYRLGKSTVNDGVTPIRTNLQVSYDKSGSILSKDELDMPDPLNNQTVSWTPYNYPYQITNGSETATFAYGPDRQRWRMVFNDGSGAETTHYIGGFLEMVEKGGVTTFRHTITARNRPVAIYERQGSTEKLRYVLGDNQNSSETFLEAATGAGTGSSTVTNSSFTAYGQRRNAATWTGPPSNEEADALNKITRQGYTYQTVIGKMGLNHMNGRVQDAANGRFLSPDPYITDPDNTQNYNRYSYVYNNPATFMDPTGFDTTIHIHFCIYIPYFSDTLTVFGGTWFPNDHGGMSNWGGSFSVSTQMVGYIDGNCVDFDITIPDPKPPDDPCNQFMPYGAGHPFKTPDEAGIDMMKSAKMYDELQKISKRGSRNELPERGSWVYEIKGSVPPMYTYAPLQTGTRNGVDVAIKPGMGTVYGYGHSHPPEKNRTYDPKSSIDNGNMVLSSGKNIEWGKPNDLKEITGLNKTLAEKGALPKVDDQGATRGVTAYLLTPDGQIKKFEDGNYKSAGEQLCTK